ncbi:acyltransferase-domain-containing protein [Artomyces pyxidatus]|uniref:Acyltransferase-domain-containing protein n=1 Tax=Artomyces pyxidatus TaxID=48021 RepID=A0ACB8T9J3_9AGAM|nr:acyltransferase-domain-containing protein [Artomyces pyxidatus]
MSKLLSTATVATIGLSCKAFINLGLCSMSVHGLQNLLKALESAERKDGRGIVTVSNHISTLDDPLTWGVMPARTYLHSRMTRWSLGASDIMFTNPVFSAFFRNGQVLETFRGKGIYQPAVDSAIEKLSHGQWVHLFGEGKVRQPDTYSVEASGAKLIRFKWGVGRILMETPRAPTIIPMWITGFENLMPEGRKTPYKYFPRLGAQLSVTFGDPIPPQDIVTALQRDSPVSKTLTDRGTGPLEASHGMNLGTEHEKRLIRIKVTNLVQRAVEALGKQVSGNMLGKQP